MQIIHETEIRKVLPLDLTAIECIESAFAQFDPKTVVLPPVQHYELADLNAEVDIKGAYMPSIPHIAIKISSGFFNNPSIGLPSLNGLMVLIECATGKPEYILADNGYLTDLRTACAGAVASKWCAHENAEQVLIMGSGLQARLQAVALAQLNSHFEFLIWGRDMSKAQQTVADLQQDFNIKASPVKNLKNAIAFADIIVTTTSSQQPIITAELLQTCKPSVHITAMGSDAPYKKEIALADYLFNNPTHSAVTFVADSLEQSQHLGELRNVDINCLSSTINLTELIASNIPLRKSTATDITMNMSICDLSGLGIQDTAIADLCITKLEET